jgi:hypothetical protein
MKKSTCWRSTNRPRWSYFRLSRKIRPNRKNRFISCRSQPPPLIQRQVDSILSYTIAAMRGNQLPVRATRWQHGSQTCLATFISQKWLHDTQHNDSQHNDTQHNNPQHKDPQHNDPQHNDTQHNDTQQNGRALFSWVSFMLTVTHAESHI